MKRSPTASLFVVLMLSALMLTACGKSEFGVTDNTEKSMTITAAKADKDTFFMVGTLEVSDGEQIQITSNLEEGSVRVELIGTPEEQSIEELPEMDSPAVAAADVSAADQKTCAVSAGSYMLKATCLKKATGTVRVEVSAP